MRLPENAKQPAGQPKDAVQPMTEEELAKVAGGALVLEEIQCPNCGQFYLPNWPREPCPHCGSCETYDRF